MKAHIGIVIGRFQLLHNAHVELIKQAYDKSERLLVLVGSSNVGRSTKNPFTAHERINQLSISLAKHDVYPVFIAIDDFMYNDAQWTSHVMSKVDGYIESLDLSNMNINVTLFGHDKDESSYYLKSFPNYNLELIGEYDDGISATDIRNEYYKDGSISDNVPSEVRSWLLEFMTTDDYQILKNEYYYLVDYKKSFDSLPYPPCFITTDSLVYFKGHVLLINRGGELGKGKWALPGGFLEYNRRVKDNMIDELIQETNIDLSREVLSSNIRKIEYFDHPTRSLRGRTVTHAGLIVLDSMTSIYKLPTVKAASDADAVKWFSINEVESMKTLFFEDHYFIIKNMLGLQ